MRAMKLLHRGNKCSAEKFKMTDPGQGFNPTGGAAVATSRYTQLSDTLLIGTIFNFTTVSCRFFLHPMSIDASVPEGATEYTTCSNLLRSSSSAWPNTSVFQIAANGVDLSKIVIGKPATAGDAGSGFMDTSTLASCLSQGKNKGWSKCQ